MKGILSPIARNGFPDNIFRLDYTSDFDGLQDSCLIRPPIDCSDWVVMIHGHGGHETQLYMRASLRKSCLPDYLQLGIGIITPNLRGNAWMNPAAVADMDAILDYVRTQFGDGRFFFCSGSMGAASNLIYAALRPQNVAGITARAAIADLADYHRFCKSNPEKLPLVDEIAAALECAYGTPEENPELYWRHSAINHIQVLKEIPIMLLHGVCDQLMPVAQSRKFAAAMGNNRNFVYREIPDGQHEDPLEIPELDGGPLEWLLAQKKGKP